MTSLRSLLYQVQDISPEVINLGSGPAPRTNNQLPSFDSLFRGVEITSTSLTLNESSTPTLYHSQPSPIWSSTSMGTRLKARRKRADSSQLNALNLYFQQNAFPSAEARSVLGHQLSMTPRAIQIWFQNKRQATKRNGPCRRDASNSSRLLSA